MTGSELSTDLSVALRNVLSMRDDANKFVTYLAMIAAPFAIGAFFLAWAPSAQFASEDPAGDGYVPPRSIERLVDRTQESTVTVWCDPEDDKGSQGTAWAIELPTTQSKIYPTTLITNHHVIDTCIGEDESVTIALPGEDPSVAVIVKWDEENDLAVLATGRKLPALSLSENEPWPGYWVMALGTADGYEGSVSFGNVINFYGNDIFITNNISSGSSGGPLIDNEGYLIGVTSWGHKVQQYNGAMSLDGFCAKILDCKYEYKGEKTWWNYTD
jgi:S1-C subfamily serine protease